MCESEKVLTASPVLEGFEHQFGDVTLSEITDYALVSIAVPLGQELALEKKMIKAFGAQIPQTGQSTLCKKASVRFLGMQKDQLFALFRYKMDDAVAVIAKKLGDTGYYTEQTDGWVFLRLSGTGVRRVLERMCMLDLDPGTFKPGMVARTVMEHLASIILCEDQSSYVLMSPRSSASAFLHAIETSIKNIQ